jgi:hypothetical protein
MDLELTTKQMAKLLGSSGGKATRKKYGDEHFKRISKLGVEAKRLKRQASKDLTLTKQHVIISYEI